MFSPELHSFSVKVERRGLTLQKSRGSPKVRRKNDQQSLIFIKLPGAGTRPYPRSTSIRHRFDRVRHSG